jgi:hypothetical protein
MNLELFKDISYEVRTECAVCQKSLDEPVIELPALPITEIYIKEPNKEDFGTVDQGFHVCDQCGHAQLSHIVDQKVLYKENAYSFRTSKSMSVKVNDTFRDFIERVTQNRQLKTIVEIGCNDMYLLNSLTDKAEKLVGVDPVLKGKENKLCTDKIKVFGDFFENVNLKEYLCSENTLVLSSHALEHIVNPKDMIENLLADSNDNTLFIFQFPGFDTMLDARRFDQIFHHHLHYFSLYSFKYLLDELGCELLDYNIDHHSCWGSLMVAFRKGRENKGNAFCVKPSADKVRENYRLFKNTMKNIGEHLRRLQGKKVYGYGAGLQIPILCYHLENDFSCLNCILDDDENKDGLFYPNLPVVIRHSSTVKDLIDSTVLLTGVNFARAIVNKVIELNAKRIVLPIDVI